MSKLSVTALMTLATIGACKRSTDDRANQRGGAFKPLRSAAAPRLEPEDAKFVFPESVPDIVVLRGGGNPPATAVSLRIWASGVIQFSCGRAGSLGPAAGMEMSESFLEAG